MRIETLIFLYKCHSPSHKWKEETLDMHGHKLTADTKTKGGEGNNN